MTDYIVASPEVIFTKSEDFFDHISSNEGNEIPLYVYNSETETSRLVMFTPKSWEGKGLYFFYLLWHIY